MERRSILWKQYCFIKCILSVLYGSEACLESKSNETVSELLARITYDVSEVFGGIKTDPAGSSPLLLSEDWKNYKDKIIRSQYHYDYGNCLSVDIGRHSMNEGLFPITFKSQVLKLSVNFFRTEKMTGYSDMLQAIFLHNGTDINMLGKDVEATYFSGGMLSVKLQNRSITE